VAYGNGTTVMDIMSSDRYIRNRFNGSNEIILPVKGYASVSAALLDVSKGLPFRSNLSAAIPLQTDLSVVVLNPMDYFKHEITSVYAMLGEFLTSFSGMVTAAIVISGLCRNIVKIIRLISLMLYFMYLNNNTLMSLINLEKRCHE